MYMSRFSVIGVLLVVAWMIVCALLFRSLKVWLVFLPAQYLLCTIILYFTHYTGISMGGEMSFGECALDVLVSVVIQFLGVGTRSLYRKLRNSIQASFAA